MSDLLGVWSLTGEAVSKRLSPAERAAMLAHLPGYPRELGNFEQGSAWLVAARKNLITTPLRGIAIEGFIAGGLDTMTSKHSGERAGEAFAEKPEGHYVLACAEPRHRRLTLLRGLLGGERLYYVRIGDLVLFASSVRPLLAHSAVSAGLARSAMGETLLTGLTLSGRGTLFDGIQEVLPGHRLVFDGGHEEEHWHWNGLLEPLQDDPGRLARKFRVALGEALSSAVGQPDRVAVALSGGIDSAAVTALAVEAFGADKVHAFTYEFDDPQHVSETPFAVEVCNKLGIRQHHVFRISLPAFLNAIPETVWRAEQIVHWPKAWMLPFSRYIRDAGFDRYLTGFGVGSHLTYLEDFSRLVGWLPNPERTLKGWKLARGRCGDLFTRMERLHAGFAVPNFRLQLVLLRQLTRFGLIRDIAGFYPEKMIPLARWAIQMMHPDEPPGGESLMGALRQESFNRLVSCVDVTRWEKVTRELGVLRISPAHFASCIPFALLPTHPRPRRGSPERSLRPGKLLLRLAMRDVLPDSILYRRKSWADAIASERWQQAGVRWMRQSVGDTAGVFGIEDDTILKSLGYWERRAPQATITALQFWRRIFVERALETSPPAWQSLNHASSPRPRDTAALGLERFA